MNSPNRKDDLGVQAIPLLDALNLPITCSRVPVSVVETRVRELKLERGAESDPVFIYRCCYSFHHGYSKA